MPTLNSLTVKGGSARRLWGQGRRPGTGGIVVGGVVGNGAGRSLGHEPRLKVKQCVIAGVVQARLEPRWQAEGGQRVERAGAPAVLSKWYSCASYTAGCEDRPHGAASEAVPLTLVLRPSWDWPARGTARGAETPDCP